jgi:hypothetical protein
LISEPLRPGGSPYHLYVVQGLPATVEAAPAHIFAGNLRLLNDRVQTATLGGTRSLVMRWQLLRSAAPSTRVSYIYNFMVSLSATSRTIVQGGCAPSSLQSGDQLIMALPQIVRNVPVHGFSLHATYQESHPFNLTYGVMKFETIKQVFTPLLQLTTENGRKMMQLT